MFQRVRHRIFNVQTVVKPKDKRSPLQNATEGAAVSVCDQQLGGQFDPELWAAGTLRTSPAMRRDIREIQVADQAVRSLGRWR